MHAHDRRFALLMVAFMGLFAVARVAAASIPPVVMAAIAVGLLIAVARSDPARRRLGLTLADWPRHAALGAAAVGVLTALLLASATLYWGADVAAALWDEITGFSLAARAHFLAIGVAAAIGEEVVFRGLLQPIAMRRLGHVGGLLVVALGFALSHPRVFRWPPYFLTNLLLIGLVYGALRGRDRPLTGALVAHALTWTVWGDA